MNNQFEMTIKPFSPIWFKQWAYIVTGSFLLAIGFVLFITPYHIIPGGVFGIGIALNKIFPSVMVGTFGLCLDIPLLLTALKIFGSKFGTKTIVSAIITPLMMNGLTLVIGSDPTTMLGGTINLTNDVLLSCIFGGLFVGVGLGLILKTHATSGGTDIIAMIVTKYFKMPISKSILFVDSFVILFGLIVLGDWRVPLYSLITIFVISNVIDYLIEGGNNDKILFILTNEKEKVENLILNDLDRSGTYLKGRGMYNKDDKEMIFVVVNRREVSIVTDYIKMADPLAFVVIANAHEIYGEGFKTLQSQNQNQNEK